MTMPCARTRSVIQAEEFREELSKDLSLTESIRRKAKRLLRHYPERREILDPSRREFLGAGQLEEHLSAGTIFQPVFSAYIEE
ncbi:MAG: BPSL0761 family protein [Pseudomonadota bacterium]